MIISNKEDALDVAINALKNQIFLTKMELCVPDLPEDIKKLHEAAIELYESAIEQLKKL